VAADHPGGRGIATTIGVLIALYIALIRDPRESSAEHEHHLAQLETIRRVKLEQFAAQARKLVPSSVRTPLLGDLWWIVRIDNASHAANTILNVAVAAIDTNGFAVPGGCGRPHHTTAAKESFNWSIRDALSESLETTAQRQLDGVVMQAIHDAVAVHFDEWPRTLPPNQHAVMAYTTTEPIYSLRVTIDYEDEAGFQWRRTDSETPRRVDDALGLAPMRPRERW